MGELENYLRAPVSNGNAVEQAMIRRWWHETEGGRGELVWEYHVNGLYIDALWFRTGESHGIERPGRNTASLFPVPGRHVVTCEAQEALNPEFGSLRASCSRSRVNSVGRSFLERGR